MQERLDGLGMLMTPISPPDADQDELERLGGRTRLVRGPSRDALAPYSSDAPPTLRPSRSGTFRAPELSLPATDNRYGTYDRPMTGSQHAPSFGQSLPSFQEVANPRYTPAQQSSQEGYPYPPTPQQDLHHYGQHQHPTPVYSQNQNGRYAQQDYSQQHYQLAQTSYPKQEGLPSSSSFPQSYSTNPNPNGSGGDFRYIPDGSLPSTGEQEPSRVIVREPIAHPQPDLSPVQQYHHYQEPPQHNWPTQHLETQVFPPYAPQPPQAQVEMPETYNYEQQSDYITTPLQDDSVYYHQQQLWNSMVNQLQLYPGQPHQPPPRQ